MKLTLLTNLEFFMIDGAMLHVHALLIEEGVLPGLQSEIYRLRGFGADPAWEVFSLRLRPEQLPVFWSGIASFIPSAPSSAMYLRFTDDQTFIMYREKTNEPLDVYTGSDYTTMWEMLSKKVAQYWHAPYMPYLEYGPPGLRRGSLRDVARLKRILG